MPCIWYQVCAFKKGDWSRYKNSPLKLPGYNKQTSFRETMKLLKPVQEGLLQANMGQCRSSLMSLCGYRSQQDILYEDCAMSVQKKEKISLKQRQSKLNRKHSIPQAIELQRLASPKTLKNIDNCSYFEAKPVFSLKRIQENAGEATSMPVGRVSPSFNQVSKLVINGKDSQTNSLPSIAESIDSKPCKKQSTKGQTCSGESNTGRTCTESHQGAQQNFSAPSKLQRGQSLLVNLSLYSLLSSQSASKNLAETKMESCKRSGSPAFRPKVCRSIIFGDNDQDENESVFSQVLSDDDFNNIYFKTSFKRSSDALQ